MTKTWQNKLLKNWCDESGILRIGKYNHDEIIKWIEENVEKKSLEEGREAERKRIKNIIWKTQEPLIVADLIKVIS